VLALAEIYDGGNRRPWFALFVVRASRLKLTASKSFRNPIAAPMVIPS
jgi:hypothetical protein